MIHVVGLPQSHHTIKHTYFGELSFSTTPNTATIDYTQLSADNFIGLSEVIWERKFILDTSSIDVHLWVGPEEPNIERLDAFALLLGDLAALDAYARNQLKHYLKQDRLYIEEHVEILAGTPVIENLAPNGDAAAVNVDPFVAAMVLHRIGLRLSNTISPVVMDYMIDKKNSDEILAVKLTANGQMITIDWES